MPIIKWLVLSYVGLTETMYINFGKDMYDNIVTIAQICDGAIYITFQLI
jgi:hypothetical protein